MVSYGGMDNSTNLVIIIMLPTVKKMQNFRALNIRNGIYIEDMRKHEIPEPRQTAKHISLWVADSLKVNRFQKLGPLEVESSLIKDLNEYCELNILNKVLVSTFYLLSIKKANIPVILCLVEVFHPKWNLILRTYSTI